MPNENSYEVALQKSNAIREGLAKTPEKFTMLTGDRPTGRLHLGHYFGTLKGRVELQNMGAKTNVLIADYQVITDRDTTEHIQDNVYNMVMDYLACGIDPDKTMIYAHSAVPAANQLMLPFLSLVSEAELARNPTVKAEMEASGHELTGLLLTYPVHQACDILFCKGNVVPVGRDQLPHIELTRTIARRFNERYAQVFPEPEGLLTDAVLIPGLDGRKMSKSLGNSPDPIELIEKYGADGVRMGMMLSAPAGNDILFDETLCEQGRNFNNKIWNAFRLVKGWEVSADAEQDEASRIATRWFESKLREAYAEMDAHFAQYRISDALMTVYRLFWDEFSSWYLEMVKPAYKDGKAQPVAQATYDATLRFFDALLRMLHPFMPFITEELWQHLADRKEGESIMVECQTVEKPTEADARLCEEFEAVKQVVAGVRSVRNQKNIAPRQQLVLQAVGTNEVAAYDAAILKMANLEKIEVVEAKAADASGFMVGKSEWAVPVGSLIDVEAELEKAKKELAHLEGFLTGVTKKLSNENFVAHAPAAVVEKERKKQADAMEKIAMVKAMIKALK